MPHISFRMGSVGFFDLDSLFVFLLNELLPQLDSSETHSYPLWGQCVQKKIFDQMIKHRVADHGCCPILYRDNDRQYKRTPLDRFVEESFQLSFDIRTNFCPVHMWGVFDLLQYF